jgi:hypothetical protein
MASDWQMLTEVDGRLVAEELKSYLDAYGIPVLLFQEGAGIDAFPVAIGSSLGRVQLFVPQADLTQARELLESLLHSGDQVEPPIPETGQDEQGEA